MELPERVEAVLDGESVAATVGLGGDDRVYVTPTRTLVYRGEGLLSDDSVEVVSHDVERVTVAEGRRKSTITLDHGVAGTDEVTVPTSALEDVLEPLLAAVLATTGVTEPGETVEATYRFSELTLVVTSEALVRQVGGELWGPDHERVPWAEVTGLTLEEGSVAAQLVLETGDRSQRTKVPGDRAPLVHETVEDALCAAHGVADYAAFEALVSAGAEAEDTEGTAAGDTATEPSETAPATEVDDRGGDGLADDGLDPIETGDTERADARPASTGTAVEDGDGDGDTAGAGSGSGSEGDGFGAFEQADTGEDAADGEAGPGPETKPGTEAEPDEAEVAELDRAEVVERLEALETVLERQADLVAEQRTVVRELREEVSRDR